MRNRSLLLGLVSVPLVLAGLALSQEPRPKEAPSSRPAVGERAD
jgi:hypothetical protein